jgi:hypothetical protein
MHALILVGDTWRAFVIVLRDDVTVTFVLLEMHNFLPLLTKRMIAMFFFGCYGVNKKKKSVDGTCSLLLDLKCQHC